MSSKQRAKSNKGGGNGGSGGGSGGGGGGGSGGEASISQTPHIKITSLHLNDGTRGLPQNPRLIKDERFKMLCESIERDPEYMTARPIVVDEEGTILGGNMRWRALKELGRKEIPSDWVKVVEGWSIEKKRRFILLDNNTYGEYDWDVLGNEFDIEEIIASGIEQGVIDDILGEVADDNPYTRKIEAPIYEITGDKPKVGELCVTDKRDELVREIERADIPDDLREFLLSAAERHTVFNFRNIAEYYAHASPEVQELFENSALVIIDFDKAIQNGFVTLATDVMEQYLEDVV